MIKETITYVDFDGNERTEDFYFNLKADEVISMQFGVTGGLTSMIERIIQAQDTPSIMRVFKDILFKSYGEKSPDGKRFIKSTELSTAFTQTEAYSKLFMELATNSDKASSFVNALIPENLVEEAAKLQESSK